MTFSASLLLIGCSSSDATVPADTGSSSSISSSVVSDVILTSPLSGSVVTSPLTVSGKAKGNWFSEANIPVSLEDESGSVIAEVGGQAQGEWMTTDFVPFTAQLTFTTNAASGYVVIAKDNPSGDTARDASVKIPVRFK